MLMASKPLLAKKMWSKDRFSFSLYMCNLSQFVQSTSYYVPPPNLLLHSSDTILTTTREVTLIKKHIILKSNRECANGNQTDINPKYV